MSVRTTLIKLIFLLSIFSLLACSTNSTNDVKQPEVYRLATRQLPPEPVYNRVRWVLPTQVSVDRNVDAKASTPLIMPIVHYVVAEVSMEEAAIVLAGTARYRSYVQSSISERVMSIDTLGTIEEIADKIEENEGIKVHIDHRTKTVRFLAQ